MIFGIPKIISEIKQFIDTKIKKKPKLFCSIYAKKDAQINPETQKRFAEVLLQCTVLYQEFNSPYFGFIQVEGEEETCPFIVFQILPRSLAEQQANTIREVLGEALKSHAQNPPDESA